MTTTDIENNSLYLLACRDNFKAGVRPANPISKTTEGYQKTVSIAKIYFHNNMLDRFLQYLKESQYATNLWTAHLVMEYGNPNDHQAKSCLNVIQAFCGTPLDPTLAKEESEWYFNFYKTQDKKPTSLNLIHLRSGELLLSSKVYQSWREIQDEYPEYLTSLDFDSIESILEYLRTEYKLGTDKAKDLLQYLSDRNFSTSEPTTIKLDF